MNTSELKISVVVPVYNCEKYIERAIESVIKQTYDNWELIIVNDGSKDSSLQIAQKFAGKDARIKVIDRENRGVSVARNIGIDEASGDLLMFLDADDWFEEKAFETIGMKLLKCFYLIIGMCLRTKTEDIRGILKKTK